MRSTFSVSEFAWFARMKSIFWWLFAIGSAGEPNVDSATMFGGPLNGKGFREKMLDRDQNDLSCSMTFTNRRPVEKICKSYSMLLAAKMKEMFCLPRAGIIDPGDSQRAGFVSSCTTLALEVGIGGSGLSSETAEGRILSQWLYSDKDGVDLLEELEEFTCKILSSVLLFNFFINNVSSLKPQQMAHRLLIVGISLDFASRRSISSSMEVGVYVPKSSSAIAVSVSVTVATLK
jgi:hypothetical protein